MVQLTSSFALVLSVAALALATPLKRDAATVIADIAAISAQVTTLDNALNAYPDTGGTLLGALTIHNDAVALINTLKTATADATASDPFTEDEGREILDDLEAIEPTILDTLTVVVAKKPAFDALPLGGVPALIRQDLGFLDSNTTAFADALIAKSPADLVDEATEVKTTIEAAFDTAIAAYA